MTELLAALRATPADRGIARALNQLYLRLYLRGPASRGLSRRDAGPGTIVSRLSLTLFLYALFGMIALVFVRRPVFTLAVAMHATTFVMLGLNVAGAAGTLLFDRSEADILQHRPVPPALLLRAKVLTLLKVSLWTGFAYNLTALVVGIFAPDGGWRFAVAHAISVLLAALFTLGAVVVLYQLCLRWVGRERVEGVVTTLQVITVVLFVIAGQVLPRTMTRIDGVNLTVGLQHWWVPLLPPAWFAGFVEAFGGGGSALGWGLAAAAIVATGLVGWLAFGVLANTWTEGTSKLAAESTPRRAAATPSTWAKRLARGPLRWWLRTETDRAAFQLIVAYVLRNREMKLRLYPALASLLAFPLVLLLTPERKGDLNLSIKLGFLSSYVGLLALEAVRLLQQSEHWAAAELFRAAPLSGPESLMRGVRCAAFVLFFLPAWVLCAVGTVWLANGFATLPLLVPALIIAPVFTMLGSQGGIPLGSPPQDKANQRFLLVFGSMIVAGLLAFASTLARKFGVLWEVLLAEALGSALVYWLLQRRAAKADWPALE